MKCEEAKYNTKRIVISGYRVMNEFLFHTSANFVSQPNGHIFYRFQRGLAVCDSV